MGLVPTVEPKTAQIPKNSTELGLSYQSQGLHIVLWLIKQELPLERSIKTKKSFVIPKTTVNRYDELRLRFLVLLGFRVILRILLRK